MGSAPGGVIDLGSSYGGWIVPRELIDSTWTCYCVGVGGDISFDLELIARYGARVRAFDAVEGYVAEALQTAAGNPLFSAHHAAVATRDGPIRMQVTHDAQSRSVSAAGLYDSESFIELPGRSLRSLMDELGDTSIELLKLDIEGAEYEVLPTLDLPAVGVKVLALQLHHTASVAEAKRLVEHLRNAGYTPVGCRPTVKMTFLASELAGP
jgi:FkbM family methyltransferase